MTSNEPILSPEGTDRAFQQLFDLFIAPEIDRRQSAGTLPKPARIFAAQVILFPDQRPHLVRLNSEVTAVARVRPAADKKAGDPILASEISGIECADLVEPEYADCGHATMLAVGEKWYLLFNFRYNRGTARRHVEVAAEFVSAARHSETNQAWSAMIDTLFSAAELAAKAQIMLIGNPQWGRAKTHRTIHTRYNQFARIGSVDPQHAGAFNKLAQLRTRARYPAGKLDVTADEGKYLADIVTDLINRVRSYLGI